MSSTRAKKAVMQLKIAAVQWSRVTVGDQCDATKETMGNQAKEKRRQRKKGVVMLQSEVVEVRRSRWRKKWRMDLFESRSSRLTLLACSRRLIFSPINCLYCHCNTNME